jgi:hypothetical protein
MPHADIFMNIIAGCESGELIMATADVWVLQLWDKYLSFKVKISSASVRYWNRLQYKEYYLPGHAV